MRGAAVTFSKNSIEDFDLILTTDMMDVACFRGLSDPRIPLITYFHENQLSYPYQTINDYDRHFAYTNFTTALSSDKLMFNSNYHMNSFLEGLDRYLDGFPDHKEKDLIGSLRIKSEVLYPGIEPIKIDEGSVKNDVPHLLWNHRWEHDKNPELFFNTLFTLQEEDFDFKLIVLGESFSRKPEIFDIARYRLRNRIIHWGFVEDRSEYYKLIRLSDILPVTNHQEFFGLSVVESIAMGVIPLLPDRLSYPEHLPLSHQSDHLYSDDEEFQHKLVFLLQNFQRVNVDPIRTHVISKYSWSNLIEEYDRCFESLV